MSQTSGKTTEKIAEAFKLRNKMQIKNELSLKKSRMEREAKRARFKNMGKNFKYVVSIENDEKIIEDGRETNQMLGRIMLLERGIFSLSFVSLFLSIFCVCF